VEIRADRHYWMQDVQTPLVRTSNDRAAPCKATADELIYQSMLLKFEKEDM
jgi:hypothetical protein